MDLYASLVAVGIGSIRNGIGMYGSILKFYTVSYALHIILGDIMVGPYVIDLLLDKFRMCQLGCEISVISEKKHTGRVAVKTPYRIYTLVASTLTRSMTVSLPFGSSLVVTQSLGLLRSM